MVPLLEFTGRVGKDDEGWFILTTISADNPELIKIHASELLEDFLSQEITIELSKPTPPIPPASEDPRVSLYPILTQMIEKASLAYHFQGNTIEHWRDWYEKFRKTLLEHLGKFPDPVPLNPRLIQTRELDDVIVESILIDVDLFSSLPLYLMYPSNLEKGEKRSAVLAAHGHGGNRDQLAGFERSSHGYQKYAIDLVKRGYIVIAPEWRNFGVRQFPKAWIRENRDPCNIAYFAFGYLGFHLLTLQINDAMRCIDYLCTRPEVDPNRIGMVGLSFGGTMTTYVAALDERIKCAIISGYLSTLQDAMSMRGSANTCGSQYSPGLLEYGDISDIMGLIAPRPLFLEMGQRDECFIIQDAREAFQHLETIYSAAGARDLLSDYVFPGPHQFDGSRSLPWLEEILPP